MILTEISLWVKMILTEISLWLKMILTERVNSKTRAKSNIFYSKNLSSFYSDTFSLAKKNYDRDPLFS